MSNREKTTNETGSGAPLSADKLAEIDAYWRACKYLAKGGIPWVRRVLLVERRRQVWTSPVIALLHGPGTTGEPRLAGHSARLERRGKSDVN